MTARQNQDLRDYVRELQQSGQLDAAAWLATLLESQVPAQSEPH